MKIVTKKFVEDFEPRRGRSFSDSEIAKALDGRVFVEWWVTEEGIKVQYECWTDSFGRMEEKTKISFPSGWPPRRKIDKVEWLMEQEEVRSTLYLLRALEVW